jgi:hypothetical protein
VPAAVGGVSAVALVARGHEAAGVALGVTVVAMVQARTVSPAFDARVGRALERVGTRLADVVGTALLAVVYAVVLVPVSAVAFVLRRPRPGLAGRWADRPAAASASPRRTFAATREARRSVGPTRRVLAAFGVVVLIVALDVAAGAVLSGTHLLEPLDRGDLRRDFLARADSLPATWADEPFAAELDAELNEFQLTRGDFQAEPFLATQVHEFHSRYVNTTDEERVSYEQEARAGDRPLRVAFFGGSVMFGLGQRDEHTIPSEFARIAEEHGVAVEVHNYGLPRWVAWQEFLWFERLLARGRDFDLAIFLDGYNEFLVQSLSYLPEPTHYLAAGESELVAELADQRGSEPGFFDGLGELIDTYHRNSGLWRTVDRVLGTESSAPGASTAVHAPPEEQAAAAMDVYRRAVDVIGSLAATHDVPVRFFWQPRKGGWPDDVLDRRPRGVDDLSHVFDGEEDQLYYDTVHTNERGAHLLAEALWSEVSRELPPG